VPQVGQVVDVLVQRRRAGWQWLASPSLLTGAAMLACYVAMGLVRVFRRTLRTFPAPLADVLRRPRTRGPGALSYFAG
jgi:hypothetical protein